MGGGEDEDGVTAVGKAFGETLDHKNGAADVGGVTKGRIEDFHRFSLADGLIGAREDVIVGL